jgi:3-oxoacyl-[acyl-carrier protein] reductase
VFFLVKVRRAQWFAEARGRKHVNAVTQRDLEGKVALVVGGSRNAGAAMADALAALGATTVISYSSDDTSAARTLDRMERHRVTVEAIRADASEPREVDRLFQGVMRRFGHLDVVVHAPPVVTGTLLEEFTGSDFAQLRTLHARSARNVLRASARHMAEDGHFIALPASPPSDGPCRAYSACKSGVERMVLSSAS